MNINNLLDKLIKTKNFKEFAFAYNTHPSPSPYYKSVMLLYLLTTDLKEYYKLLQSITIEESLSQEINFVVQLDLLINTCNFKKIKEIKATEEVAYFIDKIINMTYVNEKQLNETKGDEDYYKDVINECICITKQ